MVSRSHGAPTPMTGWPAQHPIHNNIISTISIITFTIITITIIVVIIVVVIIIIIIITIIYSGLRATAAAASDAPAEQTYQLLHLSHPQLPEQYLFRIPPP